MMLLRSFLYALAFVPLAFGALCKDARADVTVFAAASLRGALEEIAALSSTPVTLSYAGSGLIARQVSRGAPADVVVLAHPVWMDWLDGRGHLQAGTKVDIASNRLVLIAAAGAAPVLPERQDGLATAQALLTRFEGAKIAMGQRLSVPAGIYAKAWMEKLQIWEALQSQLIETDNVRVALTLVARGDVPFGITYLSDAYSDPRVSIIHIIDPAGHDPIRYPAAAVTDAGRRFVHLLASFEAQNILRAHGFAHPLDQ